MSTDPTSPIDAELTAGDWHVAAARAAARDRTLLEEAFAGIEVTDELRSLFAAVVWNLGRDHVLTLAQLPVLLATRTTEQEPAGEVERADAAQASPATRAHLVSVPATDYRRAVAEHDQALTGYFLARSRHRADAVGDAGRRLLDLVERRTGHPSTVLALTGATTGHPVLPEHWPRSQRVSAVRLETGQLLLGYLDGTSVCAFGEPERIEYVLGRSAVTVHTHAGRTVIFDPYAPTYRVFTESSPADADLITCARSIMISHLDPAVVASCVDLGEHDVIDHATARKIAHAYQWGWATCWFAGEGEIGHTTLTGRWRSDPTAAMMHALFGWWQHSDTNPDGASMQPGEDAVIAAMGRYLTSRAAASDLGPVPGWRQLPIR
jgi:hypothetical protein